jgi:hypothetical protein
MDNYDIIRDLGLWKWLIFFLVITIVPAINNLIRDYVRDKREQKLHSIIINLAEMPKLLEDIRVIASKRFTENISLSMCETLLQPIMENSARFLIDVLQEMIEHNDIQNLRPVIEADLHITIETIWAQNSGWLSKFKYKDHRINEAINDKWKDELKIIINQCLFENPCLNVRAIKRLNENIKTEFENIRFNTISILQKF